MQTKNENATTVVNSAPSPAPDRPRRFDWDGFLWNAKYIDVVDLTYEPRYSPPTMTSPDGRQLYIRSMDLAVPVDDVDALRRMLNILLKNLRTEIQSLHWSCQRIAQAENDYLAVREYLAEADAVPEGSRCPEEEIELAWEEFTPFVRYARDAATGGNIVAKLAAVYAASANPDLPVVDSAAVEWAEKVVASLPDMREARGAAADVCNN